MTILFFLFLKITYFNYAASFEAVFTYKIKRNEVGIIINKAVAVKPKILTSMGKIVNKKLKISFL